MRADAINYAERARRLQHALPESKVNFLLVTHLPNIRYLTGFTGSAAALLLSPERATLFTDGRYTAQAKEEVRHAGIVIKSKSPVMAAAEWLDTRRRRARSRSLWLGIEPEWISAGIRDRLGTLLRGKFRLRSTPQLVERARMVKDAHEIRLHPRRHPTRSEPVSHCMQ